jgi:segregation and condensation protein B
LEKQRAQAVIEALLFVSGEAIPVEDIGTLLEMDPNTVNGVIDEMMLSRQVNGSGIQIMRLNDKVQFCTNKDYAPYIQKLMLPERTQNLSQSALETLSIIAYKQPVTKSEIEAIRGVRCDYSISLLLEKGMIVVAGKKETIGRPLLYTTNEEFLRHFGLSSLKELPQLEQYE